MLGVYHVLDLSCNFLFCLGYNSFHFVKLAPVLPSLGAGNYNFVIRHSFIYYICFT